MEDWKEIKDAQGNTTCFFNLRTGITQQERPFELGGKPPRKTHSHAQGADEDQVKQLL